MSIGISNATQEDEYLLSDYVSEDEWLDMNAEERKKYLAERALDWSENYLDLGASVE